MVNELMRICLGVFVILTSCFLVSSTVFAFVISPSSIEVPILKAEDTFSISLVSDVQLSLLKTNCTSVMISFFENELFFETPIFATSNIESCVVSVFETGKPSVSFDFPVVVQIYSILYSNLTISYDITQLIIHNEGSGRGTLFVRQGENVLTCALNPGESCVYTPKSKISVCEDVLCEKELFSHEFTDSNEELIDETSSQTSKKTIKLWFMWVGVIFVVVFIITLALYYFTRRNRTFLKNTS